MNTMILLALLACNHPAALTGAVCPGCAAQGLVSSQVYSQAVVAQPVVSSYVQTVVAQPVLQQVIAQPVVSGCYSQGLIAQPVLGMGGYSQSVIGSGYGVGAGFQQGLLVGGGRGRFRSRTVIRQRVRIR